MAKIKISVSQLPLSEKLIKGSEFINMGNGNGNVPGNAPAIAALTAAQTALAAAVQACEEARNIAKQRTADCQAALAVWMEAVSNLAAFTQSATDGDAGKILSAGFDVCLPPVAVPIPDAVTGVTVRLNGSPGYSKISWKAAAGADGYLVQGSPDPITPTSWEQPVVSKKTRCVGNGASPGQKYWYRIAAFNAAGQGPWSQVAERPVM